MKSPNYAVKMVRSIRIIQVLFLVSGLLIISGVTAQGQESNAGDDTTSALRFAVKYDSSITESFTGRVYLMFASERSGREPRFGPGWINPAPFFAIEAKDWKPGEEIYFDKDTELSFPEPLDQIKSGSFKAQAVMRRNIDSPNIGTGAGSAYSQVVTINLDKTAKSFTTGEVNLTIKDIVKPEPFKQTKRLKLVNTKSNLLSQFYGRDITLHTAVILPKSYDEDSARKYPTLYWIGGFGSSYRRAPGLLRMLDGMNVTDDLCVVVLDPSCYFGHHVFADSATNGPRGESLITEIIPQLENEYRLVSSPDARFLTGASSGGWSSLWLQVTYPDYFGGTWSLVPDPVDFRDFQRINLYTDDANMYQDENGNRRPLMRFTRNNKEQVMIWYEDFAKMEVVMGPGGQLRSFEAVFSPLGADGLPMPLYNRQTGAVNHEVAESWKPYDIRLKLENNWQTLAPKLHGKIHVFAGELDNFYLDGAARLLKKSLADLGSDAVVEILPGKNHGSVLDQSMMHRIHDGAVDWFASHRHGNTDDH